MKELISISRNLFFVLDENGGMAPSCELVLTVCEPVPVYRDSDSEFTVERQAENVRVVVSQKGLVALAQYCADAAKSLAEIVEQATSENGGTQ